uniref:Uncharacterized protein n=1 Tax=viral metagenome TaxID=1070528 RepID=A0A6M3J5B0_9ZZZZ
MELKELINEVVEARAKATELKSQRDALLEEWNKSNQELFDALTQAGAGVAIAETKLREKAIETYLKTLDKAVAPGVGIRVMTKLGYDSKEAMDWAVKHELALKLDTSAFEKIAKTNNLPFVTMSEEPTATIATNLEVIK